MNIKLVKQLVDAFIEIGYTDFFQDEEDSAIFTGGGNDYCSIYIIHDEMTIKIQSKVNGERLYVKNKILVSEILINENLIFEIVRQTYDSLVLIKKVEIKKITQ